MFSGKQIDFILQEGEGYKIEFKKSASKIDRELVAFSNASGGKILVGITDARRVLGINITEKLKSQIQDIARNCGPAVKITLESLQYHDKEVLFVNVFEGQDKPYSCKEGFFIRNGPNTEKLRRDEVGDFFKMEGKIRFDELINPKFNYASDFNNSKIKDFLKRAQIDVDMEIRDILINLEVAESQEGELYFNNAGILFFVQNPQKFFRSAYVTCARYKGNDRAIIIDRQDIYGSPISQVEESLKFIRKNIRLRYEFTGEPARKEIYEYPLPALREAVINAVMHRDYLFTGSNIYVHIYSNRIEVISPGGLFKIRYEDLGKRASRRNEIIADLFYRVGFGEKVGSGIGRMNRWMLEHGLETPKIDITENFFEIDFYGTGESPIERKEIDYSAYSLNERQIEALKFMERKGKLTLKDFRNLFQGVSRKTLARDMSDLVTKKLVQKNGNKKGTFYTLSI
jgi:ATP-dependent DNA helicase RecG